MNVLDLDQVKLQPGSGKRWTVAPQRCVEVKTYRMQKHQPAIVLATCGDMLLLKLSVVPDPAWWWVTPDGFVVCHMDQTRQGYRFTRTIAKLLRVLRQLAYKAGRKRATEQQLAERAAARVGRDGECQICANRQILQKGVLVLHGYQRPGDGMAHGECHGRGYEPYEVSCDRLRWYVEVFLVSALANVHQLLTDLPRIQQLPRQVSDSSSVLRFHTEMVARGERGFDRLEEHRRSELKMKINSLEFESQQQGRRLAAWRSPAEVPRGR